MTFTRAQAQAELHERALEFLDLARRGNLGFVIVLVTDDGGVFSTTNMTDDQRKAVFATLANEEPVRRTVESIGPVGDA